ncbi:MAG: acetoacetate--CoA ligase [Rhodospirillales bacterium]|nr:acetoacetate--CoA ligase [Alphaproteobacteria bacterium]MBL6948461.1 acetoacetate--CoA ligase [Rhodospirillales bacterium]
MNAPEPTPLWQPDDAHIAQTNMTAFIAAVAERWGVDITDTSALHRFSITEREKFWQTVIDFAGIRAETWGAPGEERVLVDGDKMPGAKWFPDARLNFAENMLSLPEGVDETSDAMVFRGEDVLQRTLSFLDVRDRVSVLAQALEAAGVEAGDRVAGYLPNMPETIIAMLAASSLGAVWSSCSPDFGVQGVLDRLGQIAPKVLFAVDGYHYNGKRHDSLAKTADIAAGLPDLEAVVVVPYGDIAPADMDIGAVPGGITLEDFTAPYSPGEIRFAQMPFDHPLYILFSSGTTGAPKCIVHSQGGALLKHATEQLLHCDIKPGDRVFFFTTCGWMMWNWLVSAMGWGATLLLYDGSPFHPSPAALFDFADAEGMTLFGTSAKFIDALAKAGLRPTETHDLGSLKTFCSTGSPLVAEGFDYIYDHIIGDIPLVSFSGGTDIMGCFCGGDPTKPIWRGEIQAPMLGVALDVFDADGKPVLGQKGELVCTKAFPSMPIGFWNDEDGSRYRAAYFEAYPNVWTHGDYIEITRHGGIVIYGRSDATLNPGGVRIGTAEIYRQVERLDEITESIVIGQDWDNDVRIILFVVLKDGVTLDDDLTTRIKDHIRANCTPRHVPAVIVPVADIPRTKSGKITELAVRDIVHGRAIKNAEALANPEALELYRNLPELR